jgi:hypothetical protein
VGTQLVLAAVTAVLMRSLERGLAERSVVAALGRDVVVSALPPDRVPMGPSELPQLNLLFYQAMPNPTLRNLEEVSTSRFPFDLLYLLTAYGGLEFDAEILLGAALEIFYATPILERETIRSSLAAPSMAEDETALPVQSALASPDVAQQIEQIGVSIEPFSTEELATLWGVFQTRYRPSLALRVSVTLGEQPTD